MTFYSVRDLRTDTKGMWESLSSGNESSSRTTGSLRR